MMGSIQGLVNKYGWRLPFVASAAALDVAASAASVLRTTRLRLTSRATIGGNIIIEPDVTITPRAVIQIGSQVRIGRRTVIEVGLSSGVELRIGDDVWISHDTHIECRGGVEIGSHVMIGEFVSIRDTSHDTRARGVPMKNAPDVVGTLKIESDVWIGRGSLILGRPEGIVIGSGSIIAANSTVSRSVPPMTIWGGSPARYIRDRDDSK